MIRQGRVVEKSAGKLKVCFERPEMCEKCGACTGHAHKELVTLRGDAQVGDYVAVEMPDGQILKSSALAYVVPLLGLMLGLLIGQFAFQTDAAAAIGGLLGLAVTWGALHLLDGKIGQKNKWMPQIIAVIPPEQMQKTPENNQDNKGESV